MIGGRGVPPGRDGAPAVGSHLSASTSIRVQEIGRLWLRRRIECHQCMSTRCRNRDRLGVDLNRPRIFPNDWRNIPIAQSRSTNAIADINSELPMGRVNLWSNDLSVSSKGVVDYRGNELRRGHGTATNTAASFFASSTTASVCFSSRRRVSPSRFIVSLRVRPSRSRC